MTKNETLMILAMLNAFYAGGKNDPQQQVHAWYLILGKYDFEDAKEAVLTFAENDVRQYASFPAVGLIVNEIRKIKKRREGKVNEIMLGVSYGRTYDMISDDAKTLISEEKYNEWLAIDAVEFSEKAGKFRESLKQKQLRLTE